MCAKTFANIRIWSPVLKPENEQPTTLGAEKTQMASEMLKMLGHPLRLQLVDLLDSYGEKTVGDLAELCEQSQPTVSLYLNRLKNMGLLGCRREGKQSYYFVTHPNIRKLLNCLRNCPC